MQVTFSRNARLFLCGTFFVSFGFGTFWVLLNLYFKELGLGESTIGRVLAAAAVGTCLVSVPAAVLIDRFPARRVLMAAAFFAMLGYAGQLLPVHLTWVTLASGLAGAGHTVHNIAAAPFFMANSSVKERLDLFGIHPAVETLAGVVGALGGGALPRLIVHLGGTSVDGYRFTLAVAAAMMLLSFIPYLAIRPATGGGRRVPLQDYWKARDWRVLLKLGVPAFLVGSGAGLIIPFLNLYFRDRFQLESDAIGRLFAVSQVLTMVGFLVGPRMARRFGRVRAAVTTELLSLPFFLIMAFTPWLWAAVIGFWFRGALMNMNQPITSNFAMEIVPPDQHAVTNSFLSFTWNAAWMISTGLGGWMIERYGFTLPMLLTVVLYLVSASIYWTLFHAEESRIMAARAADGAA